LAGRCGAMPHERVRHCLALVQRTRNGHKCVTAQRVATLDGACVGRADGRGDVMYPSSSSRYIAKSSRGSTEATSRSQASNSRSETACNRFGPIGSTAAVKSPADRSSMCAGSGLQRSLCRDAARRRCARTGTALPGAEAQRHAALPPHTLYRTEACLLEGGDDGALPHAAAELTRRPPARLPRLRRTPPDAPGRWTSRGGLSRHRRVPGAAERRWMFPHAQAETSTDEGSVTVGIAA